MKGSTGRFPGGNVSYKMARSKLLVRALICSLDITSSLVVEGRAAAKLAWLLFSK